MSSQTTDLTRGIYRRQYSGFIKGQRINNISLEAEAWFWRVLATVDDFGNADADPELVWLATKGKRKGITVQQVTGWLREMKDAKLIETYKVKDEHFLHVVDFENLQPAGKNGKRIQKVPIWGNPGESRLIQKIPDLPKKSQASHNHYHNHTQDHNQHQDEKPPPRAPRSAERGTRIPEDFCLTDELREFAETHAPHVDLDTAFEGFRDYWRGVAGARARKVDWPATFKNRLRDLEGYNKNGSHKSNNGFTTANERRAASFNGLLSVVEKLRDEGSGTANEDVRGQPVTTGRGRV